MDVRRRYTASRLDYTYNLAVHLNVVQLRLGNMGSDTAVPCRREARRADRRHRRQSGGRSCYNRRRTPYEGQSQAVGVEKSSNVLSLIAFVFQTS